MKASIMRTVLLAAGVSMLSYADELGEILSTKKSMIFDYQMQTNELESDKLSKSWVNPVMLRYNRSFNEQFKSGTIITDNFTVSIDQPIFRSGGIYYAIKYSEALREANDAEIRLQRRMMIADAVTTLFNIHKNRLQQKKMRYQINNDKIDIRQKRDSYNAGLLDSSFLDQAMLKKSQDETTLLELQLGLRAYQQQFTLLSDKDPDTLKLPTLTLVNKKAYKEANLELQRDRQKALEMSHNQKMTWAKYLPTVSVSGQYTDGDINPLFQNPNLKEKYYSYGISVSMPLDINTFDDIEASKVAKLQAEVQVLDREDTVEQEYEWILSNLEILERKIALAREDEKLYENLYEVTSNLAKAGEKTSLDADVMQNTLQIRKLDQKIYAIDKQIELLKLYARMAE
ncbi:TolC family protein [Sulfurovum sp.]|jgi:outer membrane protein TolC|uniref:TolC family protein n=1 Tax=Sulfurovum sp. TaxID=1969726 RepID=UPI002A35AC7D|nr:TolC family protein [Sulfurovum sp.]MDD2450835.1 TolC family protein [Sulfurovum sp.]MDD3498790.1 TolC family protein [Sulfurovum sp.]MDY0402069.1 TolC family protein [Sulfurovum sp.]